MGFRTKQEGYKHEQEECSFIQQKSKTVRFNGTFYGAGGRYCRDSICRRG